jgi:hypothetical protein
MSKSGDGNAGLLRRVRERIDFDALAQHAVSFLGAPKMEQADAVAQKGLLVVRQYGSGFLEQREGFGGGSLAEDSPGVSQGVGIGRSELQCALERLQGLRLVAGPRQSDAQRRPAFRMVRLNLDEALKQAAR